jgi:hypothetical protein
MLKKFRFIFSYVKRCAKTFLVFCVNIWLHFVFFVFFGKWFSNVKKLHFFFVFVPV